MGFEQYEPGQKAKDIQQKIDRKKEMPESSVDAGLYNHLEEKYEEYLKTAQEEGDKIICQKRQFIQAYNQYKIDHQLPTPKTFEEVDNILNNPDFINSLEDYVSKEKFFEEHTP